MTARNVSGNRSDDILNVTVCDGKYTLIQHADFSTTVLRHGEPWPAFEARPPDNLHLALAREVDELRSLLGRQPRREPS